ncbi:MAG: tRNA pseudouridine(55) synthase TruB, partial [Candidatus Paceibacterota bacterium]
LAREGKDFKMPEREIEIYEIELLNYKYPKLEIRVLCSSGTYIRTLAEDIGKKLNTGAYLTKLIRTKVGEHKVEDSIKLEDLSKEV